MMNFYRPVLCVSGLSLSLCAALLLKDNHAEQFVLQGSAEWASRGVKCQGHTRTHTFRFPHTHIQNLRPVVLNDLWPVHYPFRKDKCFWRISEGKGGMAALSARLLFLEKFPRCYNAQDK